MYSVPTGWLLNDIPEKLRNEASKITLRGYDEEWIRLSGDFTWKGSISVDEIASDICPVRKDLYNYRIRTIPRKQKDGKRTWGRVAGMIVEPYCTGLLGKFDELYSKSERVTYQILIQEIENYSTGFFAHPDTIKRMGLLEQANESDDYKSPEYLGLVLQYSARNELAALGIDYLLESSHLDDKPSLPARFPISLGIEIKPNSAVTGISQPSTPDFLMESVSSVGDIKSGSTFKISHQMTCTGYALARESEMGEAGNTDFGIIYFVETQNIVPAPARTYFFVISDKLRRAFIDRRDRAYAVLSDGKEPDIRGVIRRESCSHCKYLELCDRDREANGIPTN